MKLDNTPILDNNFLIKYNGISTNLSNLQEEIYDFFDVSNKEDIIPFDENNHEYNMDFSYSDLIIDDLNEYEEELENWEITNEEYRKAVEQFRIIDDRQERLEEISTIFARNLQLLFDLITELKWKIDKKIINESIYFFKSNIEEVIKEKWNFFKIIFNNDLKEIDNSPYLYIYNTLIKEAQRIDKAYKLAYLEKDLKERLKLLWQIDFSDLNLVSKFENTIEKHDLNLWTIEMLSYYKYMFERNIKNMWDNISFSRVIEYKTKLLEIVKLNIEKILLDSDFNDFLQNEFIWHLFTLKDKLNNDINNLQKSITKYNKELLLFPDLTNIIKIHNILNHRKDKKTDPLLDSLTEINDINISNPTKKIESSK